MSDVEVESDEPEPVTRTRRWEVHASFDVPETPDPVYDVQACDSLADELYATIEAALRDEPRIRNLNVEDVSTTDD